jgi:hypothetical protein
MEKEISSGTMLGIVLIALAAVIGLGFGVFSIAKGVANEGTVGVQDNLAVVGESAFEDYNDKIVTGTMVKSAVQNFTGKSVGILINTTAMDKAVKPYVSHQNIMVYTADNGALAMDGMQAKKGSDAALGTKIEGEPNKHYYVNYNALFGDTASAGVVTWDASEGKLTLKDGIYNAVETPFAIDALTGKIQFDYSVGGFGRTGNCEYLNATAKFDANLIKDETGVTIGIVFTQRAQ